MNVLAYYLLALVVLLPVQMALYSFVRWLVKSCKTQIRNLTTRQLAFLTTINIVFALLLAIPHRSLLIISLSIGLGFTLFTLNTYFNFSQLFLSRVKSKGQFLLHLINFCIHPMYFISWMFSSVTAGVFDDLGWYGYS